MTADFITFPKLPAAFNEELMMAFCDYSVAIGRLRGEKAETFTPLGSGVLIKRGNHFGVLTARHCLHACSPKVQLGPDGSDVLVLTIRRGRSLLIKPHELVEHVLVTPNSEEFGPDLTFVEIKPGERLNTVKAIGSFYPLDRRADEILEKYGSDGTPVAAVGFPEVDYHTSIQGNTIEHRIRHMTVSNVIKKGDVIERDGWDYLESTLWYGQKSDLPITFSGFSGGPVWGMHIRKHETDGHFSINDSALIGIIFYQTELVGDERRLRAHFVKSIYDIAWRNVDL